MVYRPHRPATDNEQRPALVFLLLTSPSSPFSRLQVLEVTIAIALDFGEFVCVGREGGSTLKWIK